MGIIHKLHVVLLEVASGFITNQMCICQTLHASLSKSVRELVKKLYKALPETLFRFPKICRWIFGESAEKYFCQLLYINQSTFGMYI